MLLNSINLVIDFEFDDQREVYSTVIRPAMMYGAETRAAKKAQKKLDVVEMRTLS